MGTTIRIVEIKVVNQLDGWVRDMAKSQELSTLSCGFITAALVSLLNLNGLISKQLTCNPSTIQYRQRLIDILCQIAGKPEILQTAVSHAMAAVKCFRRMYLRNHNHEFTCKEEFKSFVEGPMAVFELSYLLRSTPFALHPTAFLRFVWQRPETRALLVQSEGFLVERLFLEEEVPFAEGRRQVILELPRKYDAHTEEDSLPTSRGSLTAAISKHISHACRIVKNFQYASLIPPRYIRPFTDRAHNRIRGSCALFDVPFWLQFSNILDSSHTHTIDEIQQDKLMGRISCRHSGNERAKQTHVEFQGEVQVKTCYNDENCQDYLKGNQDFSERNPPHDRTCQRCVAENIQSPLFGLPTCIDLAGHFNAAIVLPAINGQQLSKISELKLELESTTCSADSYGGHHHLSHCDRTIMAPNGDCADAAEPCAGFAHLTAQNNNVEYRSLPSDPVRLKAALEHFFGLDECVRLESEPKEEHFLTTTSSSTICSVLPDTSASYETTFQIKSNQEPLRSVSSMTNKNSNKLSAVVVVLDSMPNTSYINSPEHKLRYAALAKLAIPYVTDVAIDKVVLRLPGISS
eukprot:gene11102-3168_t